MKKRWAIKSDADANTVQQLSQALTVDATIATVLVQRGIDTFDKAKAFFRPSLQDLHNPFLMLNMQKAVDRIKQAIDTNNHIVVFGDYDVDGTTAVSLVYDFFESFYKNISFYIPDRYAEGYGLSCKGVDHALEQKSTLIIALDCGIKDFEEISYAKSKGVDVIVCDHHHPDTTLPEAYAILNPKQHGCPYPYKELSGCGIGFKLIQAWSEYHQLEQTAWQQYLDLAAISTAADIVDMTGENRIITFYGLQKINTDPRLGIETLLKFAGFKRSYDSASNSVFNQYIDIHKVVFTIAPRINAAGRIAQGTKSVELLLGKDISIAEVLSEDINQNNTARQLLDKDICEQALEMIEADSKHHLKKSTVVYHSSWHKGVVGIVASRLIERHFKPTIVLTQTDDVYSGSARSIPHFDLYVALDKCSDLLENFGGHPFAAGLTLHKDNLPAFIDRFEQVAQETLADEHMIPEIDIDSHLDFNSISQKFVNVLDQMAPFGPGNMLPIFTADNVYDVGFAKVVKDVHLSMTLGQQGSTQRFRAIAFNMGHLFKEVQKQSTFSICFQVELNTYNGNTTLQLKIKDIQFPE